MSGAGPLRRRVRQVLTRSRACPGHGDRVDQAAADAGASTVEMVLLTPLVLLLTFLPIQTGLVLHARHVATAAAQEGARAARAVDLDAGQAQAAGVQRAEQFAATLGDRALRTITVQVDRGPEQVQVQVRGRALGIVPGVRLTVTGRSVSPVERFAAQ